jgi:hypothetical protein
VWLRSADTDGPPSYDVRAVGRGPLVEALTVGGSTLWVSCPAAGESVTLPQDDLVHVYVASGALLRNSLAEPLAAGDAMLATGEPGPFVVTAGVDSELLVWTLPDEDQTS